MKRGASPTIFQACEDGNLELLETFLRHKNRKSFLTTPNQKGRYPLHVAALCGKLQVVERLIAAGADVNVFEETPSRWSVLHFAAHGKNKELFYFLVSREDLRKEGTIVKNRDGNTPLHYYCRFFNENYKNVVNMLVEKGAEVNAQNRTGETPLHNACWYGHVEIVQVLLDLGAKPNLTTITTKETPLHWAARLKSPDIVALLLNAGADPTIEGEYGTPLQVAQSTAVRALLEANMRERKAQTQASIIDVSSSARAILEKGGSTPFPWEIKFSDIKLGECIGSGGFGCVYKGKWKGLDVAVKMLSKKGSSGPLPEEAFNILLHEISVISKLRNANILLFLGACLEPSNICLVTELMPYNLRMLLKKEKIERSKKLSMAIETTKAIQYLHGCNPPILHCDLKTQNLLVDENYHIKVADFGCTAIAQVLEPGDNQGEVSNKTSLVHQQQYGATLYCLVPEVVLEHQAYTAESDIYALGMVFYELFTEKIPFEGLNNVQVLRAIDTGELPPLPEDLETDIRELILRCWNRDPAKRPTTDEILQILRSASKSKNVQ